MPKRSSAHELGMYRFELFSFLSGSSNGIMYGNLFFGYTKRAMFNMKQIISLSEGDLKNHKIGKT